MAMVYSDAGMELFKPFWPFQFTFPKNAFERRSDSILRISMLGHRTRYAGYSHRYFLAPPPRLRISICISSMKRYLFSLSHAGARLRRA
jgi:hypothetical protein